MGKRTQMKAALCETLDGADGVVVREVDDPGEPGPGQVRVTVGAAGISFADLLMTRGGYQNKPAMPFVLGGEASGHVTAVGDGVSDLAVGDVVLLSSGCVEHAVVEAGEVRRIPNGVDIEAAASFRSNYATALYGMQRGRLQATETLLVHGAGGGVGLAAVDVGKLMGATVIATASTEAKLAVAKELGADHLIDYTQGFREKVKELTGGLGADVIYDPVGGD
ncbi:MAG: zinc-binding dehydrogenase, partial [Gammaproteobacteria bacterium]|nr:zinc-binding dehydrogenase [Gammaproteobacteria bacterium]